MKAILIILILLVPNLVNAQGAIPVQQITWTQISNEPTQAQALSYKLYVSEESGTKTMVPLSNVLCGYVNFTTECSTVLPNSARPAIITNNYSQLSATDMMTAVESPLSLPFKGDQGCIFRNGLYAVGIETTITANNKNDLQRVLQEFKTAKFKHISTTPIKNSFQVREECVGYIVQ